MSFYNIETEDYFASFFHVDQITILDQQQQYENQVHQDDESETLGIAQLLYGNSKEHSMEALCLPSAASVRFLVFEKA